MAGILAIGLVRGLFWAAIAPVPGPIDEAHHFAYVVSLARGEGIPVVGRDVVPDDIMGLIKSSPTGIAIQVPLAPTNTDLGWGVVAQQYEGHQPPLYYALLAVPVAVVDGHVSPAAALYLARVITVLLALGGALMAYVLARELFPDAEHVWLLTPAVLVVLPGFNSNLAMVTNDAAVATASAAVLFAAARGWRRGFTWQRGACAGVLMGVAQMVKGTTAGIVPLIAILLVAALVRRKATVGALLSWGCGAVVGCGVVALPWLIFNVLTYPETSAARLVFDLLTVHIQPPLAFGADAVSWHARAASTSFWSAQMVPSPTTNVINGMHGLVVVSGVIGAACSLRPATRSDGLRILWLSSALIGAFVVHIVIVYAAAFGGTITSGRLLYAALIPTVLCIVASVASVAGRWSTPLLLTGLLILGVGEIAPVRDFSNAWYGREIVAGDLVPAVEQDWNDEWRRAGTIVLDPTCPTERLSVTFRGTSVPSSLAFSSNGARGEAPLAQSVTLAADATVGEYDLPAVQSRTAVEVPASFEVGASAVERASALAFAGDSGDPVATTFCRSSSPLDERFADSFAPLHPPVTRRFVLWWPIGWAAGLGALLVLMATRSIRAVYDRRT